MGLFGGDMTIPVLIRSRMSLEAAIRTVVTQDSSGNVFGGSEGNGPAGTYLMHFVDSNGVTYKVPASPADLDPLRAQAQAIAAAWNWSEAAQLKREAQNNWGGDNITNKIRAAMLLRASSQWTNGTLTAAEKNAIQNVLDNAATVVINYLRT